MLADVDLAQLIGDLPDAVVVVDPSGVVTYANEAVTAILGHRPDDLVGGPPSFLPDLGGIASGTRVERTVVHRDGRAIQAELTVVALRSAGTAVVVRDVAVRRSLVMQLVANAELMTAMARGAGFDETMRLVTQHVRDLLAADACWVTLAPAPETLASVIGDGGDDGDDGDGGDDGASSTGVVGTHTSGAGSRDVGPLLIVEVGHPEVSGMLAAARWSGAEEFTATDRDVARQFAGVISMAIDLDRMRRQAAEAEVTAEHARIARDLHDTVMQRLFAQGLMLETAAPLAPSPVAERIQLAVIDLDDMIREIRETIFDLQSARR